MANRRTLKWAVAAALVLGAGAATAAIALTYATSSTVTTTVAPVPVQFAAGDDAGPAQLSTYVSAYSISTNKTYFAATVRGVPEATLVVDSFVKLTNVDSAARTVTLATPRVTNAYVSTYKIDVYDASNVLKGTLTLTADSPTASMSVPAGATYTAKLTLALASGAGVNNVALSNAVTLSVA